MWHLIQLEGFGLPRTGFGVIDALKPLLCITTMMMDVTSWFTIINTVLNLNRNVLEYSTCVIIGQTSGKTDHHLI